MEYKVEQTQKSELNVSSLKQLIILINPAPNSDMGTKLHLFLNHVLARGKLLNATNYALMLTREEGRAQVEVLDVKSYNFNNSPLFPTNKDTSLLITFQKQIQSLGGVEPNSFDQIVIIGAGVPSKNKDTYSSINGFKNKYFPSIISCIQNTIIQHLKDNGTIRVQVCHSAMKSPVIPDQMHLIKEKPFSECIKIEGKNLTVSAPLSYSVISPKDGRAIDVIFKGTSEQFNEFAKQTKKFLNSKNSNDYITKMTQIFMDKNKKCYDKIVKEVILTGANQEQILIKKDGVPLKEKGSLYLGKIPFFSSNPPLQPCSEISSPVLINISMHGFPHIQLKLAMTP